MPSQWPLKSMLLRKKFFRRLGVIGRWQLFCTEAGGRTVGSSPRSATSFDTMTAKNSWPPAPALPASPGKTKGFLLPVLSREGEEERRLNHPRFCLSQVFKEKNI